MDVYIKISSGQFVMYADLDLSEEVSARNVYLHVCLCSEEKKLERVGRKLIFYQVPTMYQLHMLSTCYIT